MKKFLIQVVNPNDTELYSNHTTFHDGDSGLDLFITTDQTIQPGETALVDLGIICQNTSFDTNICNWFTKGFFKYNSYLLLPRSSISKTPLLMRNSIGLIDAAYLGHIKAPLYNTSNEPFTIKRGQRYVQLVNSDLSPIKFTLTNVRSNSSRGTGGFGSTGN